MSNTVLAVPIGLWFGAALGFVVGAGTRSWQLGLIALLTLVFGLALRPQHRWQRLRLAAFVCLGFIFVGLVLSSLRLAPMKSDDLFELIDNKTPGLATVTVLSDPVVLASSNRFSEGSERYSIFVRLEGFRSVKRLYDMRVRGQLIGAKSEIASLIIGSKLEVRTSLRQAQQLRGVGFLMIAPQQIVIVSPAPWWQRVATELRAGLVSSSAHLSRDAAALLPGLTLGDTSVESDELTEAMRASGLAHLTAVSGANVAIVIGAVLLLTKLLQLPRWAIFSSCFIAMAMFAVLVRFEPSVLRASVMAALGLVALILGRSRLPSAALVAAVSLLILTDPWLALSWAFALSVCATAGIIWLSPWLIGVLKARWAWLPRGVPEAFALTVSAQVATAPLTAALGNNSLIVGVPANVLAAPAVPFITIGGLFVTFVTPLSDRAGQLIATLVGAPTQYIAAIAHLGAESPGAKIPWPTGLAGVFATLVLFGLVALAITAKRGHPVSRIGLVRLVAVAGAVLLVVSYLFFGRGLSLTRPFASWPPSDWLVVACDVGQGDGLVFKIDEATAMVSDVGAEPESIKACLSRLGITSVPIVLLTHFHSDHAGALDGLVGFGVESIGVTALRHPESVAQMVGVFAERARAEVYELSAGQSFDIGDMSVQLIWPPKPIGPALTFSDAPENDASLVFMVSQEVPGGERSFTTLVTGDIEQMAQGVLARNWSWGLVDLYKVPHHGSVVQDERLPALTKAKTAVVSVGAENSFGHPHERTLDLLSQANMHVFRTDQSGDIAFSWRDDEVSVATRR